MRKFVYIVAVIVLIFTINGLARSIYDLWTKRDVVLEARKTLEKEKKENQEIKKDLARVQTKEFIEQEARNKLFLTKPDEKVVIIPSTPVKQASSSASPSSAPNWKKWLELFL